MSNLCDNCLQKPKYGGFDYCGKACAAQMKTKMCEECGKKAKFVGHKYCSKACAQVASTKQKAVGLKTPFLRFGMPGRPPLRPPGRGGPPTTPTTPGMMRPPTQAMMQQPMMMPQQMMQQPIVLPAGSMPGAGPMIFTLAGPGGTTQMPQQPVQYILQQVPAAIPMAPAPAQTSTTQSTPPAQSSSSSSSKPPQNKSSSSGALNFMKGNMKKKDTTTKKPPSKLPVCAIPDCDKTVHVDDSGEPSYFCSTAHRAQAVKLGLAEPCIFCQKMPQTDDSYFCGAQCTEEAMTKTAKAANDDVDSD